MVDLLQHRDHIINVIRSQFNSISVPYDDIEDAYQEACLAALQAHRRTTWSVMVQTALRHVGREIAHQNRFIATEDSALDTHQHTDYDTYLEQILYNRHPVEHLDYRLLDHRYRNQLTQVRQQLWDMRISGIPAHKIYKLLNRDWNWVCVTEHSMLHTYKTWIKNIQLFDSIEKSSIKDPRSNKILTLYCSGYTPQKIANIIGNVTRGNVSLILFKLKSQYCNKPLIQGTI